MREESKSVCLKLKQNPKFNYFYSDESVAASDFGGFKFPKYYDDGDIVTAPWGNNQQTCNYASTFTVRYHEGGDGTEHTVEECAKYTGAECRIEEDDDDSSISYYYCVSQKNTVFPKIEFTAQYSGTVTYSYYDIFHNNAWIYDGNVNTDGDIDSCLYIEVNGSLIVNGLDVDGTIYQNSFDVVAGDQVSLYFKNHHSYDLVDPGTYIDVQYTYDIDKEQSYNDIRFTTEDGVSCTKSITTGFGYFTVKQECKITLYYDELDISDDNPFYLFSGKNIIEKYNNGTTFYMKKGEQLFVIGLTKDIDTVIYNPVYKPSDDPSKAEDSSDEALTIRDIIDNYQVSLFNSLKPIQVIFEKYDNEATLNELLDSANDIDSNALIPIGLELMDSEDSLINWFSNKSTQPLDLYLDIGSNAEIDNSSIIHTRNIKYLTLRSTQAIDSFFASNNDIEEVYITSVSNSCSSLFTNCGSLVSAIVDNCAGNISRMFTGCTSLESVNIKKMAEGTNADYIFSNSSIKTTTFPLVKDSCTSYAFSNCGALTSVDFLCNLESVTVSLKRCDYMFNNCYNYIASNGKSIITNFLKAVNMYEYWLNGTNRTVFFNCAYNGTIPEKFMEYNKQKENLFCPSILISEMLRQTKTGININSLILYNTEELYTDCDSSNNQVNYVSCCDNAIKISIPAESNYYWQFNLRNIKNAWYICGFDFVGNTSLSLLFYYVCNYKDTTYNCLSTVIKNEWTYPNDPFDIALMSMSSNSVSSELPSCDNIFDGVSFLKSVKIDSASFSSLNNAFSNCQNLGYISGSFKCDTADSFFYSSFKNVKNPDVSGFTLQADSAKMILAKSYIRSPENFFGKLSVANLSQAFYACENITKIENPVFNSSNEVIQDAFAGCPNLVSVEGDWVDPNSSLYYQNYTMDEVTSKNVASFNDPTTKSGFSIPSSIIDAYGLFRDCPKLTAVRNLKLSTGTSDWMFQNDTALQTLENIYLNESGSYTGIFDGATQNSIWKIWCPRYIKNKEPYNRGSDNIFNTGLDPEKVPVLWVDDGYITIEDEFINVQSLRRLNYVNIVDPDKKYAWKFFSHPYALTAEHFGYNKIVDTTVYYGNKNN